MKVSIAEAEFSDGVLMLMSARDRAPSSRYFTVVRGHDETVWQPIVRGEASECTDIDEALGLFRNLVRDRELNG